MFKGIQKVSLVDYPGVIAATLFTGGCNFNCSWCHNRSLVEPEQLSIQQEIPENVIQEYLLRRTGKIQGVCITGGEPTLWGSKLEEFLRWCKANRLLVKLDTNGYLPDVLNNWLQENLLDFVAMDIKNVPESYGDTVQVSGININSILQSIEIIRNSSIPHLFRTTVVPGLVQPDQIRGFYHSKKLNYVLQEYRDNSVHR